MSKLNELIAQLCPDGVPYKELSTICCIETGKLNANAATEDGKYLFFTTAKEISRIDSYRWDAEALLIAGNANVGDVKYYVGKFEAYQRTYVLTKFSCDISAKFLYYYLNNSLRDYLESRKNDAAMTYIVLSTLQQFMVPIPPLPVQSEIVRILDNFTELTAELTTKLAAELTARKQQYEYYRDELLTRVCPNKADYRSLGEVCKLVTGATPSKTRSEYWENGTIPWMSSGEVNNKVVCYTEQKITQLGYDRASTTMVPIHSVVIALAGQGKTRGKVAITEIELCTNQSLCSIICGEGLHYKFLYYYLDSKYLELRSISNGDGTRGGLSLKILSPYKIPVPPLSVQDEIVRILDYFSSLCDDISAGLPAEIEARQKQYEYYRDRLLAFKEIQ